MASTSSGEQPFEGGGQRQFLGGGFVEDGGQRFGGGVELEHGQVAAELLVEAGLRGVPVVGGRCRWWRLVSLVVVVVMGGCSFLGRRRS